MNSPDQEADFWTWFANTLEPVPRDLTPPDSSLLELTRRLREIDPNLTYEIHTTRSGPRSLIVSANSNPRSFSAVVRLAQSAPLLARWKIVPFRPRIDLSQYKLELANLSISPREILFRLEPAEDRFDLAIYLPKIDDAEREKAANLTMVLLDLALGEYDVATSIRYVDHLPKPADVAAAKLLPITELSAEFDRLQLERAAAA